MICKLTRDFNERVREIRRGEGAEEQQKKEV
jgi:hypothetical protein